MRMTKIDLTLFIIGIIIIILSTIIGYYVPYTFGALVIPSQIIGFFLILYGGFGYTPIPLWLRIILSIILAPLAFVIFFFLTNIRNVTASYVFWAPLLYFNYFISNSAWIYRCSEKTAMDCLP